MKITYLMGGVCAAAMLLSSCGGGGGSSSTTTTPVPAPVNNPPVVASANSDQSARVGTAFSYDATQSNTTFSDADGDTLSYTVSYDPAAQGLTDTNGVISGTPSQEGTVSITITASDGNGGSAADMFDIVISPEAVQSGRPNIVFIISDDQGKDSSAQYNLTADVPTTPNLTARADSGVIFENAWVSPTCSPTRAALITGKHADRTKVFAPGDALGATEVTLQSFLKTNADTAVYSSAMIGKWHLGGGQTGPNDFGVDYFAGIINGGINDYFNWSLNENGVTSTSTNYATTELTNLAIDWVDTQDGPWFLWLSYNAPHTPIHLPPNTLHSRDLSGTNADINANPRNYYLAAIEAMDSEFGRFWDGLDNAEQDNTIVVYLGDNGTPADGEISVAGQSGRKGALLQGGINTPLFVSGPGISRAGEREDALVTHTDMFATLAELAGATLPAYNDSQSFAGLLSDHNADEREFAFTEHSGGWAIRNARYKLIQAANGNQDLYDLTNDPAEQTDLLGGTADVSAILSELETEAGRIRGASNITGVNFSNPSPLCADYIGQYTANATDVMRNVDFQAALETSTAGNRCTLSTNSIPNHDFNDGDNAFANDVGIVNVAYSFSSVPTIAATTTPLNQIDNAIMLNGVKVDILSAGCFGVGDGRTGCNDPDALWRFDPMFEASGFQVDKSNAHAQPNGAYHYHGPPPITNGDENTVSGVIGYAADGFPIFGPYFDNNGTIRKAASGYRLKSGSRPTGANDPGGTYDGTYRDDYEHAPTNGDLDICNGMTVNGQYGYYVTEDFPYMIACFSGTPDQSFFK